MLNEKRKNKLKIVLILVLMAISVGALSYSFGWVTLNQKMMTTNYFSISEITFGLTNEVSAVALGEVVPTLDKFGILNDTFMFTVTNNSDNEQNYVVKLVDSADIVSTIPNNDIRYQLMVGEEIVGTYNLSSGGFIDAGTLAGGESINYGIKVWLDYDATETDGVWNKVVFVEAGNNGMDTSGANVPSLIEGMIPVYYDETEEVWKKADEMNLNKNHRWYDYDSLVWANVVTVSEESRKSYLIADLGTTIDMEDINSMWVWIPRYKYTLFNSNGADTNPTNIGITFEKGLHSTGTVTCHKQFDANGLTSEVCTDQENGSIIDGVSTYTHPAFTFDNRELDGIWVAKFEAGVDSNSACATNSTTNSCNVDNLEIYIKPNIESLSYITMANLQTNFRKMELADNVYGFTNRGTSLNSDGSIVLDSNEIDIHMIKNSEWGAVAYLYHSKYGKYGNNSYSQDEKELYHNDTNTTGYSMGSASVSSGSYQYNVHKFGTGASTTGNVYGVYDLKGGMGEMVMLNFQSTYKTFVPGSYTGFNSPYPKSIYYDAYYSNTNLSVTNLGDALKETKWYSDVKNLSTTKVLYRGGLASSYTDGIFGISSITASTSASVGSRPVLKANSSIYISSW